MLRLKWCRARRYVACSATVALSAGLLVNGCAQRPSNYTAAVVEEAKERADQTVPRPVTQQRPQVASAEGSVQLSDREPFRRGGQLMTPRSTPATASPDRRRSQPSTTDPFLIAQPSQRPEYPPATKPPEAVGQVRISSNTPKPGIAFPDHGPPSLAAAQQPGPQRSSLAAPPMPTAAERLPVASPEPPVSRLAQLRDQLREAAFADARPESNLRISDQSAGQDNDRSNTFRENDRGVLLSDGRNDTPAATPPAFPATAPGFPSESLAHREAPEGRHVLRSESSRTPTPAPAEPIGVARVASLTQPSESIESTKPAEPKTDPALQVQSLLAAAEWHVEQGDLQRAYQSATFAQRLADREKIVFQEGDRRPADVARNIWRALHEPASTGAQTEQAIAAVAGRPSTTPSVEPTTPTDTFPARSRGVWQTASDSQTSTLTQTRPQDSNELPTITPWSPTGPRPPARSAAGDNVSAHSHANAPLTVAPHEPDVEAATGPVSLASIETHSDNFNRPRDSVVNAMAEVESHSPLNGRRPHSDRGPELTIPDSGLTVPAMAAFPKWDDRGPANLPASGPALTRPTQVPPPPSLDVIGSQRATEMAPAAQSPKFSTGTIGGLIGLIVGIVGSAVLFRRKPVKA